MPYVTINFKNYEVEAADVAVDTVGTTVQAYGGRLNNGILALQRKYNLGFLPLQPLAARELLGIFYGTGHSWSFDDASYFQFSTMGTGPIAGSNFTRGTTTPDPRYGAAYLMVNSAAYCEMDLVLDNNTGWTVMFWHNPTQTAAGTWTHYAVTSTGNHYASGSFSALAAQHLLTLPAGRLRLNGKNTANTNTASSYDDLVYFPCVLAADSIAAIYNSGAPMATPAIYLSGDIVEDTYRTGTVRCVADLASITATPVNYEGDVRIQVNATLIETVQ